MSKLINPMQRVDKDESIDVEKLMENYNKPLTNKKDPRHIKYLILYYMTDEDGEEIRSFEFIEGRKEAYEFIKSIVEHIDIENSKVVAETVSLNKAANVYKFMKFCAQFFGEDDGFDIDEFNIE